MANTKITLDRSPVEIDPELRMDILRNTIDSLTILDYYFTGYESHDVDVLAEDVHQFMVTKDEIFKFQLSDSEHKGKTYLRLKHRFPYVDFDMESFYSQDLYDEWRSLNRLKTYPSPDMTLRPEDLGLSQEEENLLNFV